MKAKIIRDTFIRGQFAKADSIVEVDEHTFKQLVIAKKADPDEPRVERKRASHTAEAV